MKKKRGHEFEKENRRGRGIWRKERELFNPIIISERKNIHWYGVISPRK